MAGGEPRKLYPWACEMAQQVKVLATKLDDLSLTCGTHMMETVDYSCDLHTHNGTSAPTHKHNSKYTSNKVIWPQTWTNEDGRHLRGPFTCSRFSRVQ